MLLALQEKARKLDEKRAGLKKYFDDRKDASTKELKMSVADIEHVNKQNDEINTETASYEAEYKLYAMQEANERALKDLREPTRTHSLPGSGSEETTRRQVVKTLGQAFVESKEFKERKDRDIKNRVVTLPDVDLKTLFSRTAGWDPEEIRNRPVVLSAQRPIQVTNLIPTRATSQDAIKFMEETTFTNNAAEVAEAGTYGEMAFALTERSQVVEKIGAWLPFTDEQEEDVEGIQSYIDSRLTYAVQIRLDGQIVNGNGTTPNLLGVLSKSGILTQAKGGDPTCDAWYKAMTKVRVTGRAVPGAHLMHPNDWQEIRLLRTADGIYIWGNPSEAGPERLWGLPVVQTDALTEGTGVTGDWAMYSELAYKRGLEIKTTNSHGTHFIEGKQAIRADVRAVLVWFRAAAFCSVTGI